LNPDTQQIGDLSVFLVGDANGHAPLLHEASDEGHIAGLNATRSGVTCFTRRTPLSIVFTDPNVAAVGKRFNELTGASFITGKVDFANQGRARAAQRNRGVLRIYAQRDDGRLLGAEMCAPAGEHLAHLLAFAIQRGLTVHELLRLPFYHPVLEEGLRTALRDLSRQLPPTFESDLAACEELGVEALD
jgi:dihydrolipoamide dehydrogenase